MNYTRGIQPSCCSKEQYEAENRKHWYKLPDQKPYEGKAVVVLNMNGTYDTDFWTTEIAYYCDEQFYFLEYDPHLGILRKQHYPYKVEYWADYFTFNPEEIKNK